MTETLRRPVLGGGGPAGGMALGAGGPVSRTAPPLPPPRRRLLQPMDRRPPVTAPRRPFRVRIYCNGDRYFKVSVISGVARIWCRGGHRSRRRGGAVPPPRKKFGIFISKW